MLCVLFMQCISMAILVVLSILAKSKLNICYTPASGIPIAIMTIPNAKEQQHFEGYRLLLNESYYTCCRYKRRRREILHDKNCYNYYMVASKRDYAGFSLLWIIQYFIVSTAGYCYSLLDIKGAKNKMKRLHH